MRYVITVRHGGATRYDPSTVAVSWGGVNEPATASLWDDLIVTYTPHGPAVLPRAPFFPAASVATMPQKRPEQAPPRAAYVRAYQRRREPRTRAEK